VFVVGHLGDWRRAAAVLFERESLRGNPAPRREPGQGVAAGTLRSTDGGSDVDHARANGLVPEIVGTLSDGAHNGGGLNGQDAYTGRIIPVAHTLRGEGFDASEDGCGRGTPIVPVAFDMAQITSKANRTRVEAGLPASTLNAAGQMHVAAWTCSEQANGFAWERDVYGSLTAQIPNDSSNIQQGVRIGWRVRRLTPTECEALQGFPRNYTNIPYRNKNDAPDGPRYKALGNSMAVNAMRWIGRRIEMVEASNG
jgi:DNA (cytosine-5)-methyltransferase 1